MDIRTKLVFALVAVALGSMAALGVVMSLGAMDALRESRLEQLYGLAEAKEEGLQQVVTGWEDRVRLIASRTQLRRSLRAYVQAGDEQELAAMDRILFDALDAVADVESLTVLDPEGRRLVTVQRGSEPLPSPSPASPAVTPADVPDDEGYDVTYRGITFSGDQALAEFEAVLTLAGEALGTLRVRLVPRELFELAAIRTALGETGQTLIVLSGLDGTTRTIRRSGSADASLSPPIDPGEASDPVRLALEGREGRFTNGVIDAGGDPVWGEVRQLQSTGWGLVVKLDAEEGLAPVVNLRRELTTVGLSLGAFAILAGIILGFRFTRPILDLAAVADRIRAGELYARASVATHDEVGLLARTFNQMADELEDRMTELREFQTFFELSRDLLCIAGTEGYFKKVNPAFEQVVGWSDEELLSRPITSFVHPDDVESTVDELERLANGLPTISFENRWRHADGGYRRLRWTCHPEPDTGLLYAVARDVTGTSPAEGV